MTNAAIAARPAVDRIELAVADATLALDVANRPESDIFFGLSVRKSGSSMFNKLLIWLARANGINFVDIPGTFFKAGFTTAHWEPMELGHLLRPGNLYGGFRTFPQTLAQSDAYAGARKAFMFRDPRDALVSQYFSDAYTHSLPKAGSGGGRAAFDRKRAEALATPIDAYVLQKAPSLRQALLAYADALDDPRCLKLRYESHVFQKRRLAHRIADHFGWAIAREPLERFMAELDFVPEQEDQQRFVRKVTPGDHRAKLEPETIVALDERLGDVLALYDYY